jgi:hypothetical protein
MPRNNLPTPITKPTNFPAFRKAMPEQYPITESQQEFTTRSYTNITDQTALDQQFARIYNQLLRESRSQPTSTKPNIAKRSIIFIDKLLDDIQRIFRSKRVFRSIHFNQILLVRLRSVIMSVGSDLQIKPKTAMLFELFLVNKI